MRRLVFTTTPSKANNKLNNINIVSQKMFVWAENVQLQLYLVRRQNRVFSALRKIKRLLCPGEAHSCSRGIETRIPAKETFCEHEICSSVVNLKFTGLCPDAFHQLLHMSKQPAVQAAEYDYYEHFHKQNNTTCKCKSCHAALYRPSAGCSCSNSTLPLLVKSLWITQTKQTWMNKPKTMSTGLCKQFSRSFSSFAQRGRHQHVGFLLGAHQSALQHRRLLKSVKMEEEAVASTEEIKRLLVEQDMKHEQGFTCFMAKCPRLAQPNKKSTKGVNSNKLFINMTTGHFLCQHCSKRGGWHDLQDNILLLSSLSQKRRKEFECFKEVDSVQKADRQYRQAQDLWEGAMPIKTCATDVVAQIQENFDIHELKASTLDMFDVRFDIKSNSLVFPAFDGAGRLMGVRRLTCTIPEENDNLRVVKDSLLPKSGVLGLFGLNTLTKDLTEIVLTCTEMDALAVYQETKAPVLALPAGFSSLPQELLPSLERFTKLVLWFGDDVRAWEAAKLFAKKLNERRCYIIRPSVEDPSPFEALRRGIKLDSVLSKAKPIVHKSIVSFAQLRQEIFSELAHVEQVAGVKWKRYTALNRLLKGHRRGELTVFTGPTGSGKTTFISDYSLDLCTQGVNTLWGSFEINNVRLGKMMLTQFAQCNLSKQLGDFDYWANQFEELPMYFMTFFGQESIRKVIEAMSHAVYVHDIAHVVVDNLQFMMGSSGEWADRFSKQDSFISAFRKFSTNMNCHVTLVIHPRKEKDSEDLTTASVFGSAKATQEADNVLILQDKRLSSVRGRKYLQVTKNRFDGELGVMLLKFDKDSLSFAVKERQVKRPVKEEMDAEENPGLHPPVEGLEYPIEEH